MSLSCTAEDWTEGNLEGLRSPCRSSMKEVCLACCPHFLKPYLRHSLSTNFEQKDNSENTLPRKVSLISANISVSRKAPNLRYWEHVSSVCPHQCSWQVWHACELSEGLLLCFAEASAARSRRLPHSEALRAATRLCCSLLGNAGWARTAGTAGGRAAFASTQTLRDTWVQSPLQRRCQKHTHIKVCWYRSTLGVNQQPQRPLFPLHPSPLHLMQVLAFSTLSH